MSQLNVERIIGQLATDEALRSRFAADPRAVLKQLIDMGVHLTPCEFAALVRLNPQALERFTRAIDSRLQKTDLQRGEK